MKKVVCFRVGASAALVGLVLLAGCGKSETSTSGATEPGMLDKLSGKADVLPDLQPVTVDGKLPPMIPGLMLAGRLNPALFENQQYAEFFLGSYNNSHGAPEATPGAETYKKMAAHAAKLPLEYAQVLNVGVGPYDPVRRGFPVISNGDARMDIFKNERLHSRMNYSSNISIRLTKPIDLTFVKTDKPPFCEGINCEAPDFSKAVNIAVTYKVESLEPFNPATDMGSKVRISYRALPLKVAMLVDSTAEGAQSGDQKMVSISDVVLSPTDWASVLRVSKTAEGVYAINSPEFIDRLALRQIPALKEDRDFVSNFGYKFMCDLYRYSSNEFEWPKKEVEFKAELERRVAETSVAQMVYTEHTVRLGQYDVGKGSFELSVYGGSWKNVAQIELDTSAGMASCPGSRGAGNMGFSVELQATPPITINSIPVESGKAQAFVEKAETKGNREACLRLTWQLAGGERVGNTSTLRLLSKPIRHELFDSSCSGRLGGAAFASDGNKAS